MNALEKINEVVTTYIMYREEQSIEAAISATVDVCIIPPSFIIDALSTAQLDITRSQEDADLILIHRNELLAHFNTQQ